MAPFSTTACLTPVAAARQALDLVFPNSPAAYSHLPPTCTPTSRTYCSCYSFLLLVTSFLENSPFTPAPIAIPNMGAMCNLMHIIRMNMLLLSCLGYLSALNSASLPNKEFHTLFFLYQLLEHGGLKT